MKKYQFILILCLLIIIISIQMIQIYNIYIFKNWIHLYADAYKSNSNEINILSDDISTLIDDNNYQTEIIEDIYDNCYDDNLEW